MLLLLLLAAAPARVSIELEDADVHAALRLMADYGDVDIVVPDDVQGTVSLRLRDVPWDEAFAALLAVEGLAATRVGGVVHVSRR